MTKKVFIGLSLIAAVCYSSFPAAIWLNPTEAFHGLVSDLTESGHPYAALFSIADIVSSILAAVIFICLLILMQPLSRRLRLAIGLALLASVGGLASALTPLPANFDTSVALTINSLVREPTVLAHGIYSFINSAAFVLSALLWSHECSQQVYNWRRLFAYGMLAIGTLGAAAAAFWPELAPSLQRIFIVGYGVWIVGLTRDTLRQPLQD